MALPGAWTFKQLGTPENILVKAGLIEVEDVSGDMSLKAGPKLSELFTDTKAVPPLEKIVPAMTHLVVAHAYDQSGFIASTDIRIHAKDTLNEAGIGNAGFQKLNGMIEETTQNAAQEIAKQKQAIR